ncbi:MAG: tetratricopeptide repeat protein [Holosporales bacterium]|nr:tetratricopeptide repeat protein [Holosporales bacterium]
MIDEDKNLDSFVDSIEDEIRVENLQRFWSKYGKILACISCVIIISIGAYSVWRKQDGTEKEIISSKFTLVQNAIMSGNGHTVLAELKELSKTSKKNYATLAKLEYAALLRTQKNIAALDEYKSIVDEKEIDKVLRDLAYIFYVSTAIELMPVKELIASIDGFIEALKERYLGKTWDLFAKETLAFCYIKKGENEQAKEALSTLAKTTGITVNMANRAKTLLHSLEDES